MHNVVGHKKYYQVFVLKIIPREFNSYPSLEEVSGKYLIWIAKKRRYEEKQECVYYLKLLTDSQRYVCGLVLSIKDF